MLFNFLLCRQNLSYNLSSISGLMKDILKHFKYFLQHCYSFFEC